MNATCSFAPEPPGSEARTGEVLELREDGFFLASNMLYPPGTTLQLLIELPDQRLPARLRGEVVWARTKDRAGMQVRLLDRVALATPAERATVSPDAPVKPRGPLRR